MFCSFNNYFISRRSYFRKKSIGRPPWEYSGVVGKFSQGYDSRIEFRAPLHFPWNSEQPHSCPTDMHRSAITWRGSLMEQGIASLRASCVRAVSTERGHSTGILPSCNPWLPEQWCYRQLMLFKKLILFRSELILIVLTLLKREKKPFNMNYIQMCINGKTNKQLKKTLKQLQ